MMSQALADICAAARQQQARARDLNRRAGEQRFLVLTEGQLAECLVEVLGGARSVGEIRNFQNLRLPGLPDEDVAQVLRDYPDHIYVAGARLAVEYRDNAPPLVQFDYSILNHSVWHTLPDGEVKLPGGRAVEIRLAMGYLSTVTVRTGADLKVKVRAHLNREQWESFRYRTKPTIVKPDFTKPGAVMPEIVTTQYGTCAIDRTPLVAYGTVTVSPYFYAQDNQRFTDGWFQSREEAERARGTAIASLADMQIEFKKRQELEDTKRAVETLRQRAETLHAQYQGDKHFSVNLWYDLKDVCRLTVEFLTPEAVARVKRQIEQVLARADAEVARIRAIEPVKPQPKQSSRSGAPVDPQLVALQAHFKDRRFK